jgi:hypothetical protein
MSVYISQIELAAGIAKVLATQFGVKDVLPRQFNAIIEAANRIIAEFERDYTPAAPGCGLAAWLASDDTGMSSKWMARQLFDAAPDHGYAHPHDADDFARCMTFVAAVPESKAMLDRVASTSPVWAEIVAQWDTLCNLMQTSSAEVTRLVQQMETEHQEATATDQASVNDLE